MVRPIMRNELAPQRPSPSATEVDAPAALIVMGIRLLALTPFFGGSNPTELFSDVLFGIDIIVIVLSTRSIFGYLVQH